MKRLLGPVAALVVVSAALALGPVGTAQAAPAKVLTKHQMKAALLTVKDLPKGFRVDHSSDSSSDDTTASAATAGCARLVQTMNNVSDPDADIPQATADFKRNHGMESIENTVMSFRSAAAVRKDFASFVSPAKTCHRITLSDPSGMSLHLKLGLKKFKVDGRHGLLVTMHGRYMGVPMNFALTGTQIRNNEVSVFTMGVGQGAAAETRLAESLLGTATRKLSKHLR